jgi:CPA1 family monovalent cation:H+ antiporter
MPAAEQERHLAEILATEETLAELAEVAAGLGTDPEVVNRLRREYEEHLGAQRVNGENADDAPVLRHAQHYTALRLAPLPPLRRSHHRRHHQSPGPSRDDQTRAR